MGDFWDLIMHVDKTENIPYRALPTTPNQMVGWGPTYTWMDLSLDATKTIANAMLTAGHTIVPLEFFGFGRANWWNRLPDLLALFAERYKIYNSRGLLIDLKLINWNWGQGHAENGDLNSCDSRLTDAWFQNVLQNLLPYAPGCILQACTEWSAGGRNGNCWQKAQRWCALAAKQWPGLKSWNQGARPTSAPTGHILDWHVDKHSALGPRTTNKIITTDTSGILAHLGGLKSHLTNHPELTNLVKAAKKEGGGFSAYTFFDNINLEQDLAAIQIIGQAWRGE